MDFSERSLHLWEESLMQKGGAPGALQISWVQIPDLVHGPVSTGAHIEPGSLSQEFNVGKRNAHLLRTVGTRWHQYRHSRRQMNFMHCSRRPRFSRLCAPSADTIHQLLTFDALKGHSVILANPPLLLTFSRVYFSCFQLKEILCAASKYVNRKFLEINATS